MDRIINFYNNFIQSSKVIESSVVSSNEDSKPLYFLSERNLDNKILHPRIPNNYFTKNGFEENKSKRISFAKSIDGCLMGISKNLKNKSFFVHIPDGKYDVQSIAPQQVPDCKITGEVWITTNVRIKCIGKIKVIKDTGEKGIPFNYGNNTAKLYRWLWEWVEK